MSDRTIPVTVNPNVTSWLPLDAIKAAYFADKADAVRYLLGPDSQGRHTTEAVTMALEMSEVFHILAAKALLEGKSDQIVDISDVSKLIVKLATGE